MTDGIEATCVNNAERLQRSWDCLDEVIDELTNLADEIVGNTDKIGNDPVKSVNRSLMEVINMTPDIIFEKTQQAKRTIESIRGALYDPQRYLEMNAEEEKCDYASDEDMRNAR